MMMGITFSGISSGLPVNDIIDSLIAVERQPLLQLERRMNETRNKRSVVDSIESKAKSFGSALKKFTSTSILDENLFQSKAATNSNADAVTVTATADAAIQGIDLKINKLATATRVNSLNYVGAAATGATQFSDIRNVSFSSGDFTVFVNGEANTINVDTATDTIDDVLGRISGITGISGASINADGQIEVTSATPGTVSFGSNADTTNFLTLTRLNTATEDPATGLRRSSLPLSTLDTSVDVSDPAAGLRTAVTAGSTFTIGKASFDTTGKTLGEIISEINNTPDAGVSATFNTTTNRLQLNAKGTGQIAVQLEDTSGNFLNAMGLMSGTNALAAQTLGENAEIELNGNTIFAVGNKVSGDVSGLRGVTLDLLQTTGTDETIQINVDRDREKITTAIGDVVKQYNDLIATIDRETNAETGRIGPNNSLRSFRSNIRQLISSSSSSATVFNSLGLVGISTAASGAQGASPSIAFDETKFFEALDANGTDVENLFKGTDGIFTRLQTVVDAATVTGGDTAGGLFESIDNSFNARIERYEDSIRRGEDRLERRRIALQKQFAASDRLISQFQSQGSALAGLSQQIAANSAASRR